MLFCLMLTPSFFAGCMNQQLELTTRRTLNTLPDLQYQQVIDNSGDDRLEPGASSLSGGRRAGLDPGDRQRQLDAGLDHRTGNPRG